MPELVAIEDPAGPDFVAWTTRCWDDGDAVFPVDRRLPPKLREALYAEIRPTRIVRDNEIHPHPGRPTEDGDAVVLATSGTTGTPKGVVLTRSALEHSARATSERLHIDHPDRWLCCIPVAHAGGFGVIARALLTNTPLEVHDGFDADAVNRSTATRTSLVATALQRIDATRFTTILLGGDAPPLDLPANVVVTYGLTETAGGCVYDGVPLNRVDITIDADREINVAGPMRGRAYRTAEGDTPIPTGTGDSGRWEDGKLVVEGRLRDVIVTGGEKVWPAAVEAALQGQPHIKDVAVVGRPDKTWGHRVVAVVVPDGEPPTLDQLKAAVKETLPAWAAPKALELADRIPRTANNKIQRNKL